MANMVKRLKTSYKRGQKINCLFHGHTHVHKLTWSLHHFYNLMNTDLKISTVSTILGRGIVDKNVMHNFCWCNTQNRKFAKPTSRSCICLSDFSVLSLVRP